MSGPGALPDDPVLVRLWRGEFVESQHRGSWCVIDAGGEVIAEGGSIDHPFFARSSIKSLQAIPLLEEGAALAFGLNDEELSLALASHNAEECHTSKVGALLKRLELSVEDLQCGAHVPGDSDAARALEWGLVNEVVEHDRLLARAREVAAHVVEIEAGTVAAMKRLYWATTSVTAGEGFTVEHEVNRSWRARGGFAREAFAQRRDDIERRGAGQL